MFSVQRWAANPECMSHLKRRPRPVWLAGVRRAILKPHPVCPTKNEATNASRRSKSFWIPAEATLGHRIGQAGGRQGGGGRYFSP